MDNATYRKNVLRTLSVKPAKLGLKLLARDTQRMNVFHAVIGIASEVMELQSGLLDYVAGVSQLSDGMKVNAFEECGDIGYYVAVAAKMLKGFKLPGAGKKVKLKGMTRTQALLQMVRVSGQMLDLAKKTLYGPVMDESTGTKPRKVYVLDAEGKKIPDGVVKLPSGKEGTAWKFNIEQVTVPVYTVNPEKTAELFQQREDRIRELLEEFVQLYWPFVYETFGVPPANVNVGNIAKLEKRYGKGYFDLSDAEDRDPAEEVDAMTSASVQSVAQTA